MHHSILKIAGHNDYELNARHWQADSAIATIIMVHGVVSHSLWMEDIAQALQQHNISCVAIDRRGAGMNNNGLGDTPSTQALLGDLHAVMQWAYEQNTPVHLCGFCWGSNYVVNYLAQADAKIDSTIFIAPSLFPSEWILQRPFAVGDSAMATEEPVMPIDQFTDGPRFESFIKPDPLRLRKVSLRMNQCMQDFSQGIWMKFLRLKHPCLMLLGEKDTVVDNNATRRVFDRLEITPKTCIMLDANHGIQFEQANVATQAMVTWVHKLHSTRSSTLADRAKSQP